RGYATIAEQYKERFGDPMPISITEYEAFTKRVRAFCQTKQLVLVIKDTVEVREAIETGRVKRPTSAPVRARPASSAGMWIAITLVILVAGGIAAAVVLS